GRRDIDELNLRKRSRHRLAEQVEHRRLPGLLQLCLALEQMRDRFDAREEACSVPEHVHRSDLDKALDDAPVGDRGTGPAGKVLHGRAAATVPARRYALRDGLLSDILDRREPESSASGALGRDIDGKLDVAPVHVRWEYGYA